VAERALIQTDHDGEFPNSALFAAWKGFVLRGRETLRVTPQDIEDLMAREPDRETLLFGDAFSVREYLEHLGVEAPTYDYPEALRSFLGRPLKIKKLGAIRRAYNEPGEPVFIKPVEHKLFTGHVVSKFRDLLKTTHESSETLVYQVGCVSFRSEWRFYVHEATVVGANHYSGDPLVFPARRIVAEAARAFYGHGAPVAYALDFGVTEDERTLLVEVNDMISLGSYGLDPSHYSYLIENRWDELVGSGYDAA
jgi:hypothetical protein